MCSFLLITVPNTRVSISRSPKTVGDYREVGNDNVISAVQPQTAVFNGYNPSEQIVPSRNTFPPPRTFTDESSVEGRVIEDSVLGHVVYAGFPPQPHKGHRVRCVSGRKN